MHDYGARMYSSGLGRWFGVDPLLDNIYNDPEDEEDFLDNFAFHSGLYNYVLNNPVNFTDFMGFDSARTTLPEVVVESKINNTQNSKLQYATQLAWQVIQPFGTDEAISSFKDGDYWAGAGWSLLATADITATFLSGGTSKALTTGFKISKLGKYGKLAGKGKNYTKSSLKLGQQMHKAYKVGANGVKEFRGIKGIRPDFIDFSTKTIYELKPFNPRALQQGMKQLDKYKSLFEQKYGGTWKTVLDTY